MVVIYGLECLDSGCPVDIGNGVDEAAVIGLTRLGEDIVRQAFFDNAAVMHDDDPLAERARPAGRGDEDQRQVHGRNQLAEEGDDLRLDGDVECGDALIGNDDARIDGERAGNTGALALAAAHRAWLALRKASVKFHKVKKFVHTAPYLPRRIFFWTLRTSDSVSPIVNAWIERIVGVPGRPHRRLGARACSACVRWRRRLAPSKLTCPVEAGVRPSMARASVDLPDPLSPTMPTVSPRPDLQRNAIDSAEMPALREQSAAAGNRTERSSSRSAAAAPVGLAAGVAVAMSVSAGMDGWLEISVFV